VHPTTFPTPAILEGPSEEWGYDELLAAVESGDRRCRQISLALDSDPRGALAGELGEVLEAAGNRGAVDMLRRALLSAVSRSDADERAVVAAQLRDHSDASGLSLTEFAARMGLSEPRLNAYLGGSFVPSAALMIRALRIVENP
jgi:hypothetical protein